MYACTYLKMVFFFQAINIIGFVLHLLTRAARFKAARIFSFLNAMVTHRLMVTLAEVSLS